MKYYDEETMTVVRHELEDTVLGWNNVTTKKMFGCPSYLAEKKLFAFLVSDGLVLTKLEDEDIVKMAETVDFRPFEVDGKKMANWARITVQDKSEVPKLLAFVEQSYLNSLDMEKD